MVHDLLGDSNPMVVSNAVAALAEIAETSDKGAAIFTITPGTLQKLLAAVNECTEWGQVFILDALASYRPQDAREAESIVERVTPRLQHANSAVVLSAVKVRAKRGARARPAAQGARVGWRARPSDWARLALAPTPPSRAGDDALHGRDRVAGLAARALQEDGPAARDAALCGA